MTRHTSTDAGLAGDSRPLHAEPKAYRAYAAMTGIGACPPPIKPYSALERHLRLPTVWRLIAITR